MRYIDVPAKVLYGNALSAVGVDIWPFDDGTNDPYWLGGQSPRDYRWVVEIEVTNQPHSSHKTRRPYSFDATDISVGDYIASGEDGVTVRVVSVLEKRADFIKCVVEDNLRYNTFRDANGIGRGIFQVPCSVVIFETNEAGNPVVDPIPSGGVGPLFFPNLMSRFLNFEENMNFLLHQKNHGFSVDDLISADAATGGFVLTDADHPFIVGTVSYLDLGPDFFMVNPLQKVKSNYDQLPGVVGGILYASSSEAGGFSNVGTQPVLLKLRENTRTTTTGSVPNAVTTPGNVVFVNHVQITVGGSGTIQDFVDAANVETENHGVFCEAKAAPTVAKSSMPFAIGEPAFDLSSGVYPKAKINGVEVTFSTMASGMSQYGAPYALEEDMAVDIIAANIPGITAVTDSNTLSVVSTNGDPIEIENVSPDGTGVFFAGPLSASGIEFSTAPSTDVFLKLTAVDARAIELYDAYGSATTDFGVYSVENGVKAAAMFIEQGIRQAATYVVANISARDAINALFGDQCFVQDKGNGEWAHYIRTLEDVWVKIADKDSSDTDAQTIEIEIDHETDANDVIYTVSGGSRVTFVTVTVTEQFNGLNPLISIGDANDHARLMTNNQNDLKSLGTYSTTPSYIYSGSSDVDITFTFDAANSTTGKAVIAISYT